MYDYSTTRDVTVTTLETGRTYHIPDVGDYPSITTLLSATANNFYLQLWREKIGDKEADRIRDEAADRGTLIHEYLERYWNKEDIYPDLKKESPDVRKMTHNLIGVTEQNFTKVYGQEEVVYSKRLGYAGRVDVIGEWNGVPAIIDFKTARKKKEISHIRDYYIQVSAYAYAHNELYGSNFKKIVILVTVENYKVQIFESNALYYIPDLKYRVTAYRQKEL